MNALAHGAAMKTLLAVLVAGATTIGHRSSAAPTFPAPSASVASPEQVEVYETYYRLRAMEMALAEEEANHREEHLVVVSRGDSGTTSRRPLSLLSKIRPEQLDTALEGTGLAGLGAAFVEAENTYQINAIVLAAIAAHESGWGESEYARLRHNLFGYGAYTENPDAALPFPSKQASILRAARTLRHEYLNGRDTTTLEEIGPIWAADDWSDGDPSWAWKVADTMSTIAQRIKGDSR